jgi:iron complex transport system substrate-binding protein
MLFAIGAGPQVVAVDSLSNYPAHAPVTDLSAYTPNAEAVATYNPDLVVLSFDANDIVSQLRALNIEVYLATGADDIEDTYTQLRELGDLTGHADEATALIGSMTDELAKIVQDVPARAEPLTYFLEVDAELWTATSQTFAGTLFSAVGLENIADEASPDNPWPQLSEEVILVTDPDLIFTMDGQTLQDLAARPGWAELTAVRNGAVVALDPDIASRWGPRVVDLQRAIADAVAGVPAG